MPSLAQCVLEDASPAIDGTPFRCQIFEFVSEDDLFAIYWVCSAFKKTLNERPQDSAAVGCAVRPPRAAYIVCSLARTRWALESGWNWKCIKSPGACSVIAREGCLAVLQFARQQGCPWDWETCAYAAKGGYLEVLQWSRGHGCPWNTRTCSRAAEGGHLEVLQWARAQGCPWNKLTCSNATRAATWRCCNGLGDRGARGTN